MCNPETYSAEASLSCRRAVAQRSASKAISANLLAVLINEETLADSVPAGYDARPGMTADILADLASLLDKEVRWLPVSHLKLHHASEHSTGCGNLIMWNIRDRLSWHSLQDRHAQI